MVISVVPSGSPPFAIRDPLHPALQLGFSESCTQLKHGHACSVTFLILLSFMSHIPETYAHRKVKKPLKVKLKKVIVTLFICSVRILVAHAGTTRICWAGATPRFFRHNQVAKSGVAPAQLGAIPRPY